MRASVEAMAEALEFPPRRYWPGPDGRPRPYSPDRKTTAEWWFRIGDRAEDTFSVYDFRGSLSRSEFHVGATSAADLGLLRDHLAAFGLVLEAPEARGRP